MNNGKRMNSKAQIIRIRVSVIYLASIAAASGVTIVSPAQAQPPGESIEDRQFQRQRERTQELFDDLQTAPSGEDLTPKAPPSDITGGRCVAIAAVIIDGMTRFSRDAFAIEIGDATGDCVSMAEIDALTRAITNAYVKKGFVTARVLLPQQDLSNGVLKVAVLEGVVEDIAGEGPRTSPREVDFAFPGIEDAILNLRDLEQGVDQMGRLRSNKTTIDIKPGAGPGGSVVVVKNEKAANRIRGTISADNFGQRATGRYNHTVSVEADGLLGLNDFLSVSWNRDAQYGDDVGARGYNGFFSLPYGYWILTLSGGRFSYDSLITGAFADFESDGDSWNVTADLDRLIYRDATRKISLHVGLRLTDTDNFIQDVRLLSSSYRLAVVNLGARYQQRALGGLISASMEGRRGLDALGAQSILTGPDGPKREFWKIAGSINFLRPVKIGAQDLRYTAVLQGQWADRNLFPAERISLGGPSTVRGFIDGGLSGDKGAFLRQEVSTEAGRFETGAPALGAVSVEPFIAYDVGGIYRDGFNPFERGVLQSASGGLRISAKRLSGQVALSHAFDHPSFLQPRDVDVTASIAVHF